MALGRLRELSGSGSGARIHRPRRLERRPCRRRAWRRSTCSRPAPTTASTRAVAAGPSWSAPSTATCARVRPTGKEEPVEPAGRLPLRPGTGSPRIEHLPPGDPSTLLTRDRGALARLARAGGQPGRAGGRLRAPASVSPSTPPPAGCGWPWWSATTWQPGPPAGPAGSSMAGCVTSLRPGGGGRESARERAVLAGVVAPHLIHLCPRPCPTSAPDEPDPDWFAVGSPPRTSCAPPPARPAGCCPGPGRCTGAGPCARAVARHQPGARGDGALGLPTRGDVAPGRGGRPDGCRLRRGDPHRTEVLSIEAGRGAAA